MKILLIEDSPQIVDVFVDFGTREGIDIDVVQSMSSALARVEDQQYYFDFAVCDLKIPSFDGSLDLNNDHGVEVVGRLIQKCSGIPVMVLSAFGTIADLSAMLLRGRQQDIFGLGQPQPMLQYVEKIDLNRALKALRTARHELRQLGAIEFIGPVSALSDYQKRVLKLFARARGGRQVRYQALSGGLSGARTGIVTVLSEIGAEVGRAVAKITTLTRAAEEEQRYASCISSRLGAGTFADLTSQITAGCGRDAGLFYSVADRYDRDLFQLVLKDHKAAAMSVLSVEGNVRAWTNGVPQRPTLWGEIRKNLLSEDAYKRIVVDQSITIINDRREFQAIWATQHGDLHGANVLVDGDARPVLIDFGRSGEAPSCLDSLTLELSIMFHPESPFRAHEWPTVEQLRNWDDLDTYLDGCPYPGYVRACREWTNRVGAGSRDIWAVICAYCLRNLQYSDVDFERAIALYSYAADRLVASY